MMLHINDEEKASIILARLALDVALDNCSFRWLFCWDGETKETCFDCACCLTWDKIKGCGCRCHDRLRELDGLFTSAFVGMQQHNKSCYWDRGVDGKQKKEP